MTVPKFFNDQTGKWEAFITSNSVPIVDKSDSYESNNVEGALQEIAAWKKELGEGSLAIINKRLDGHDEDIKWLKAHGGGGGGGVAVPTIESTLSTDEKVVIPADSALDIAITFKSPNLGNGLAYIVINDAVYDTQQVVIGLNKLHIEKFTELTNTVSIYAKDRTGVLSNTLTWTVINGGIGLELDFDYEADYSLDEEVRMDYVVTSGLDTPLKLVLTIGSQVKEIPCNIGNNSYDLSYLDVGVHKVSMYVTDGEYKSKQLDFSVSLVNSTTLLLTSDFDNANQEYASPISIKYRISYGQDTDFPVTLYLDGAVYKTLTTRRGSFYWIINERIAIGPHTWKIEVDDRKIGGTKKHIEGMFTVVQGDYTPLSLYENNMVFRLNPAKRGNTDDDREEFVVDGCNVKLHNFNFAANGWINGELVCSGGSYVEIDFQPYIDNAKYGSTVEIYYKTIDIGNDNAMVLDYRDPYSEIGFCVGLDNAQLNSVANKTSVTVTPYDNEKVNTDDGQYHYTNKNEYNKVSFVVDRKNKFGKVYVNGICSRAFKLSDSGSGVDKKYESFYHEGKMYINMNVTDESCGYCFIKDIVAYSEALSADDILKNTLYYIEKDEVNGYRNQKIKYDFNFNNTSLPKIQISADQADLDKMTLENKVTVNLSYLSSDDEKYGQSFTDLPCEMGWQGTSSLSYVLKNYQVYLRTSEGKEKLYTPYKNGVLDSIYCFKADYMESSHARNVGLCRFANDIIFGDIPNPAQAINSKVRNAINGFPALLYINGKFQGVYNFNNDRYSSRIFGYTNPDKHICYEISANTDSTAGAFFSYEEGESQGKTEQQYYASDFMAIYPPTKVAGNDSFDKVKRLVEFVSSADGETFTENLSNYFNKEYLLRYFIFVQLFGLVDNLGKNMKIASWDGGNIWYIQPYDCDTSISLNNSGFQMFDCDIEVEKGVYNTTDSRLWQKVMLYMQDDLKTTYEYLRNNGVNIDTMYKYIFEDQIDKIPEYYYNKDMQTKYLDFDASYLYALHGNSKGLIMKWLKDRLLFLDSFYDYKTDMNDNVVIRVCNKDDVQIAIQTFTPMYFTIKWRNQADGTALGTQKLKVNKGEATIFTHKMETDTDQEVILYCARNIKDMGDLSILKPATILMAEAYRVTKLVCHSVNLTNLDLSECENLVDVDLSGCTQLGTGVTAQGTLDVSGCDNLLKLNCEDTAVTYVNLNSAGSNIQEMWLPKSIRNILAVKCRALHTIGLPHDHKCSTIKLQECPNLTAFGDLMWNESAHRYDQYNGYYLSGQLQELYLDASFDLETIEIFYNMHINKVTLLNLKNTKELILGMRINAKDGEYDATTTYYTSKEKCEEYGDFKLIVDQCPNFDTFTLRTNYKRKFKDEENYFNNQWSPHCDQDPTGSISYVPTWNPHSGFHCRNLDLSESGITKFNVFMCAFIKRLALPSTVDEIHIDSTAKMYHLHDGTLMNEYERYGKTIYYGWIHNLNDRDERCQVECACPPIIYSIADTIENCEHNVWKMGSYNLQDFELGTYNVLTFLWWRWSQVRIHDCTHEVSIRDLNLHAHHHAPCFMKDWIKDINGVMDLSEYDGNYLIRTFAGITDSLQVTLPSDTVMKNLKYISSPLRGAQTTQFDWRFAADLFKRDMHIDRCFWRTKLREQSSPDEVVNLINHVDVDGDVYYDKWKSTETHNTILERGVCAESNIKYVGNVETSVHPYGMFNNCQKLISVGDCKFGDSNTKAITSCISAFARTDAKLQSVGTITVDYNNLVYTLNDNTKDYSAMFYYCDALTSVGNITLTNINADVLANKYSWSSMPVFNNCFERCTNLIDLPTLNLGGLVCGSFYGYAKTSPKIKTFVCPPLFWDTNLNEMFYGCGNLNNVNFEQSGLQKSWYNPMWRFMAGCGLIQRIPGFVYPQARSDNKGESFSGCSSLREYYPPGDSDTKNGTYNNCRSMVATAENGLEHIVHYSTHNGKGVSYGQGTYSGVQAIKKGEVIIRYTSSVLNSVPNKLSGRIECAGLQCGSIFSGCTYLEEGTFKIEDLGKIKFVQETPNLSGMFNGCRIRTLTFDPNIYANVHDNKFNMSSFVSGSYIEIIENYPLNVMSDNTVFISGSFGSQIQEITWAGMLEQNWNIKQLCSSMTNIPVKSIEDLLKNHLATMSGAIINLGTFKSLVSEEAIRAAEAKGWTVTDR